MSQSNVVVSDQHSSTISRGDTVQFAIRIRGSELLGDFEGLHDILEEYPDFYVKHTARFAVKSDSTGQLSWRSSSTSDQWTAIVHQSQLRDIGVFIHRRLTHDVSDVAMPCLLYLKYMQAFHPQQTWPQII